MSMDKYIEALGKTPDFTRIEEKTLTPAEMKKREEVAKAIERENPGIDKSKKMAIATATAKRVAEAVVGSKPRNEKEKKLAAMSGKKDEITFGDVLKARGVTKEEAEQVEEGMSQDIKNAEWFKSARNQKAYNDMSFAKSQKDYQDNANRDSSYRSRSNTYTNNVNAIQRTRSDNPDHAELAHGPRTNDSVVSGLKSPSKNKKSVKEEAEQIDEATPGVKKPKMDPVQRARNSLADPKTKAHTLIKHIEAAKKYNFERGKGYTFDEEVEHVEEARAMDYKMSRSGVAGDRGNSKGGEITVDQKQKDEIAKIFAKPDKTEKK